MHANDVENIRQQSQHQNNLVENNTFVDDPIIISPSTSGYKTYPNSSNDPNDVLLPTKKLIKKPLLILLKNKKTRRCPVKNTHKSN